MTQQTMLLMDELIVDNFAGGGGASLGIEQAVGRQIDIAINHDLDAVAMHKANHPATEHYLEDVWDVDPLKATGGRPVGLAWFSPDCKHFSKAKGGKPVEKKIRGLAWVVIRWAAKVKPRIIMLENVEEFQTWGPLLTRDGKQYPCPVRKGHTFRRWKAELERLGYVVEMRELRACDYGAPTIRKRLFIIARCDGQPIVWPEPTHGPGRIPYRTAAECIDWSLPCPSIFERKRPLAEATMRRIARGVKRFVIDAAEPFIVPVTHHGDDRVHSIKDPMRTITTAQRGEFALVAPQIVGVGGRMGQSEPRSPGRPYQTITAKADSVLVAPYLVPRYGERSGQTPRTHAVNTPIPVITPDANCGRLVTAFLAKHFGGNETPGWPLYRPISTVTAQDHHAVVAPFLTKLYGTCQHGQDVRPPAPTITGGGNHIGAVYAFLMKFYGEGGQWADPRDPMHTIPTKDRMAIVTVHGEEYVIADIGMRMLEPFELFRAQGFPQSYIIDYGIHPVTGAVIRFPKSTKVRLCGNSVSPVMSRALVEANVTVPTKHRKVA